MRSYEALVIVDASLEEGEIQKAVDRFSTVVTDNGGNVTNVDRWGIRRFAYEIAHKNEGYYFLTNFESPEDVIANLERTIRISDEFIRGKIIRPE
jgi:small subunit ribosomal protein S6